MIVTRYGLMVGRSPENIRGTTRPWKYGIDGPVKPLKRRRCVVCGAVLRANMHKASRTCRRCEGHEIAQADAALLRVTQREAGPCAASAVPIVKEA